MSQTSLKKNFAYNIVYQILIVVLPLITSPYLTRVIGASGLGIYTYTQSYAHYFALFIMLGVNNYGNREIAKVRDDKILLCRTFWEIYSFQALLLCILSAAYCLSIVFIIDENKTIYWIQFLYVVSAGLDINWCCFGLEKFKLTVVRNAIIKVLSAVLIFMLIHKGQDLWLYTLVSAGALLLSQIVVWPFIVREIGFTRVTRTGIISHIKPNLMLFLPVVAISLYTIMDKLMLGLMDDKTEVAYYSYAGRLIEVPETVIIALNTVLLPRASNMLYKGQNEENSLLLNKSMQFTMLFCMGAAFGLSAVADVFIPWYYGDSFSRCTIFTICLSPVIVFTSWNGIIRNQFVIPKGYDQIYLATVSSGAIVNLVLNYLLIPRYRGIGAVVGTLVAQFVVCVIQYMLTKKDINYSAFWKDTIVFFFLGAVMGVMVYSIPSFSQMAVFNIIAKVVVGSALYILWVCFYLVKIKHDKSLINSVKSYVHRRKSL